MSVYTVHEPPRRGDDGSVDPGRIAFVRDGFYVWAFLLTPLWMLWHGMWLVLVIALALVAALDAAAYLVDASSSVLFLINALVSLLVGFEASTLRRWTLRRHGWNNVGIVIGDDLESAERRFFDSWVDSAPVGEVPSPPAPAAMAHAAPAARAQLPDVIGLFPQPGAQR